MQNAPLDRELITSSWLSLAQKKFAAKCGLESRSARMLNQHNRWIRSTIWHGAIPVLLVR
ncbi:hypothetical protein BB934_36285 (plasmid) [Microvirga ossetica]|uniref:Uncharacterized protein n=1 Tax=Microvirga ossetica TaxID=1882682 RepID=A0A1B2EUR6_9HYPH|nr:hypothetical protein BB934_36285 [Microvirga ossetica]